MLQKIGSEWREVRRLEAQALRSKKEAQDGVFVMRNQIKTNPYFPFCRKISSIVGFLFFLAYAFRFGIPTFPNASTWFTFGAKHQRALEEPKKIKEPEKM